jgi:hypothetical protein
LSNGRADPRGSLWLGSLRSNVNPDGSSKEAEGSDGMLLRIDPDCNVSEWKRDIGHLKYSGMQSGSYALGRRTFFASHRHTRATGKSVPCIRVNDITTIAGGPGIIQEMGTSKIRAVFRNLKHVIKHSYIRRTAEIVRNTMQERNENRFKENIYECPRDSHAREAE